MEINAYVRLYLWYRTLQFLLKMVSEKERIRGLNVVLRLPLCFGWVCISWILVSFQSKTSRTE